MFKYVNNRTSFKRIVLTMTASVFFVKFLSVFPVSAQTTQTITPSIIPLSSSELVNPMGGYYKWRGVETVPLPEPSHDVYERYYWRDPDNSANSLEISQGVYNFSKIDAAIAAAEARASKFAFRVRSMLSTSSGKRYIPDYLSSCGWNYNGTFIPDWNASCYLNNARNLLNALGARYNNDPRVAWIDIGMYGNYGEWAFAESIYSSAPTGITAATDTSLGAIVDMHLNAFPKVRKVMFAKTRSAPVIRALSSSDQVGWRVDCLGQDGYFDFSTNPKYTSAWPYMENRWKTAPVIVEFCASNVESTYTTAINQVKQFHIATVGNGNFGTWSSKTSTQQANLILLGKTAGYRFQIKQLTIPSQISVNLPFSISTSWENIGVSPHYEKTTVLFQLFNTSTASYVWEYASTLDLQKLLPTGSTPFVVRDTFTLPSSVVPGTYQLRIVATDPVKYRKPLKLAISGMQTDGSYVLGSINVLSGQISSPTHTPTTTLLRADANGDGKVDELDYSIWKTNYDTNSSGATKGDFDSNNRVDGIDYLIWLNDFDK